MSLYGIGTDIAHIPRFVRLLSDHALAVRLQRKMLHPLEIAQVSSLQSAADPSSMHRQVAEFVASRWAVKEAVTKAFGARLLFPDIRLCSPRRQAALTSDSRTQSSTATPVDPRPSLRFSGQCAALMAAAGVSASSSHVSLSHDGDYAVAFVTLCSQRTER